MRLIVDCGATKAHWCLLDGALRRESVTEGFNLSHVSRDTVHTLVQKVRNDLFQEGESPESVFVYAAGYLKDNSRLPELLQQQFPAAAVQCESDLVGAARAVCGRQPGVAVILGTGSNSCQWDGNGISAKVHTGGFILGDEGGGAVLGRLFVADYIKGLVPPELAAAFEAAYPHSYAELVRKVYREDAPARFLGSIVPLLLPHYQDMPYVRGLVDANFRAFFERVLCRYDQSLPVGVVGGFGHDCRDILESMGRSYGIRFSTFMPSPMEGLAAYHAL